MKIYISLPMSGHSPADSLLRSQNLEQLLHKEYRNETIELTVRRAIRPGELLEVFNPVDFGLHHPELKYEEYMARDIEQLLQSDAILLGRGWLFSKGCRLEWAAAHVYGIPVLIEDENKEDTLRTFGYTDLIMASQTFKRDIHGLYEDNLLPF